MQNIESIADALIEDFETFDDWQDRYTYIIDMGRKLPPFPDAERTEENRVLGCQSRVWIVARTHICDGETVIEFLADSDAAIVKGLLAVVHALYSGQRADEILSFDFTNLMERLQLAQNLSANRGNGLRAVVDRLKWIAATIDVRSTPDPNAGTALE